MTPGNDEKLRCGLLGGRLGHSFSPQIHRELGSYSYRLFPMPEEQVPEFLRNGAFDAINVTIPYKQTVMPYCSTISDEARKIGSVNTLLRDENGGLHGFNTDYYGFAYMAARAGISFRGRKVLILGSGGTSCTARAVAVDEGASEVIVVSRSGRNHYGNLHLHRDAGIIVNTTPVGMFPDTERKLISLAEFSDCAGVLDVIYNPLRTRLLQEAEKLGLPCSNGLPMLVAQARKASELFVKRTYSDSIVETVLGRMRNAARNIVLIGMPGCGKTTLGKMLAERLDRQFLDLDAEIAREQGKSIPQIFAESGEAEFRRLEEETIRKISLRNGLVVATGGGAVLSGRNCRNLRQNGWVCYVRRPLELLETGHGRPLSGSLEQVRKLFEQRNSLYLAASDCTVENNGSLREGLEQAAVLIQQG